jgi:hypothetical protein
MKICHIVPVNYVRMCTQNSTMHLLIAPEVLKNKQYEEVYREKSFRNDFIIMDNGAFEYGNAFPLDDVIKATELVWAKELVLPDCYLDGAITIQRVKEALNELSNNTSSIIQSLSLMAVPQGKTIDEYEKCFLELLQMNEVDTIGFSYGAINEAFRAWGIPKSLLRIAVISYLNKHFNFSKYNKQFHCLGIGGHPIEIKYLKRFEFIRSADSSKAFICALNDIDIKETHDLYFEAPKRPDDYFGIKTVSESVEKLVLKNIETMEKYNSES